MNINLLPFGKNIYKKFVDKRLSLNDQLAASRSMLANERTFLSYQRTALTQLIAGLTLIKFFGTFWIELIGWMFLPTAIVTTYLGVVRYRRMRDLILNIEDETAADSKPVKKLFKSKNLKIINGES